ncbi:MAG: DUF2249 domain-containing protein [Gammaproteobacteria bacterium]|nr:DUF2249 domain-containing protein [Gammaproteobacteria bacterium]
MEHLLDVSGLEAPEPLLQALGALGSLAKGDYLRLQHRMKPCHLYPQLEKGNFACETRCGVEVACELFIWHQGDEMAAAAARKVAATLPPWSE